VKIKIDLAKVIEQAAPQVFGSDERERLYDWLGRNTSEQLVTIDLRTCGAKLVHRKHRPAARRRN
jgi:hypothetical protein